MFEYKNEGEKEVAARKMQVARSRTKPVADSGTK